MYKKKKKIFTILFGLIIVVLFAATCPSLAVCSETETEYKICQKDYTEFFSTASRIRLYVSSEEEERAQTAFRKIEEEWRALEKNISVSLSESDISRFNRLPSGKNMEISETTYDLLAIAKDLYQRTEGAYNPAVAPLVDLWGFSPRFSNGDSEEKQPYDREDFKTQLPQEKYITAFKQLTNFDAVSLNSSNGTYYISKPAMTAEADGVVYGMQLDLGGIAKGYACDMAYKILGEYGFDSGYINVGRSSMRLLKNTEGAEAPFFSIRIKNPRDDELRFDDDILASVTVKDCGLSTSGDYERYYVTHNIRYSHLISAETGKPIDTNISMACVIGGSAAENDALTTALCVMGKEKASEYITTELSDKTALFVWKNDSTGKYEVITNREKGEIVLNEELKDFELCGYMREGTFVYDPSTAFNLAEIVIATALTATVIASIIGLGYRNHVLKRDKTNQDN